MRGGIATMLGILGGVLILLGVFIGVLFAGLFSLFTFHAGSLLGAAYQGAIDVVLGFLILIFTGYARSHPPPDKAIGGVVVLILAVIAWYVSSSAFLVFVTIGSILAGIGGLIFLLESAFQGPPAPASH